jgi:hypothetical protein
MARIAYAFSAADSMRRRAISLRIQFDQREGAVKLDLQLRRLLIGMPGALFVSPCQQCTLLFVGPLDQQEKGESKIGLTLLGIATSRGQPICALLQLLARMLCEHIFE